MKKLVAVATFALSAATLSAVAGTTADRVGEAASPAAERIIVIDPNTSWVYVNHGEIVKIVANGQEFTRNLDGASQSLNSGQIALQGPECIAPWSFDKLPFGRCPDR